MRIEDGVFQASDESPAHPAFPGTSIVSCAAVWPLSPMLLVDSAY